MANSSAAAFLVGDGEVPPTCGVSVIGDCEIYVNLAGFIDPAKEVKKLEKRQQRTLVLILSNRARNHHFSPTELQKQIAGVEKQMNSKSWDKRPAEVQQAQIDKKTAAESELALTAKLIENFSNMSISES